MHTPEQIMAYEKAVRDEDRDRAKYIVKHPAVIKSSKGKHPSNRLPAKKKRK